MLSGVKFRIKPIPNEQDSFSEIPMLLAYEIFYAYSRFLDIT